MAKKIFVSYNFNDKEIVHSVKNMLQSNGGKINGQFSFVTSDFSAQGNDAINKEIKKVMSDCDAALFLVGDNSHNSPWINREVQLAKSLNLHIVLTRLPDSRGAAPKGLTDSYYPEAEWKANDLAYCLNKCQ
ncbi:toll/interleukin-1 receptor domain-containing protein [Vibrio spartinae]|uniref:Thoeris protein ThsB TIR-like domain-containing protein n=1 Tax=Vibrio spartinae TaxID=1918945 RepID=A0A1N6M5Q2_9VIBR|nr:toll/interleukin-1 receptor domain-containing protein [Vibrio spartinae]SIO94773.1 hypothetical protein VSP9026_02503 [Vibrio spartinae]